MRPEPFTAAVEDEAVADLKSRLRRTRYPLDIGNATWRYGTNADYLRSFVAFWLDHDWRETEAEINSFANFRVVLDGVPVHFLHERGKGPSPLPLILTHGWPWTFWDFKEAIGPLTDPGAHGGDPADAFDVVIPSLPGFGFSGPLEIEGVQTANTADRWAELMTLLGYDRFAVAGSDLGVRVSAHLAHAHSERVIGLHATSPPSLGSARESRTSGSSTLDMLLARLNGPVRAMRREDFAPEERHRFDLMEQRWAGTLSHVAAQSTDPQTLAYGMHDSPVALAAWLLERRYNWSDHDGLLDDSFARRALIDLVGIYWFTETFVSSARMYWHEFRAPWSPVHDRKPAIDVPVGVSVFPVDVVYRPRRVAEENANLVYWQEHDRGGHFAWAEVPELLVADVREFFRPLRRG
ncbi:alpha/beta fold hydrolase [Actinomadura sp. LD22]|uniref:Alpha/beta fold hydrolase n=1 Tax=Actinomadura physcomitrii TaxID=2650748 RepID=A0A6I4ME76_9ACTN|nr:epoxide hydrolase [Actinomadura physcomitrii]MWA03180.1 alpha/beta fold hydrolase [Actinomadura physcomitrii]